VAAKPSNWKLIAKWMLILVLLALAIPPLQIVLTMFWNPPWSPMQIQRQLESRLAGKKPAPVRQQWVPLDKTPVELIHYIWSSEDQAFFEHHGFDLAEMGKAIEAAQKTGKNVRGSSTITMQCARSVFLWQGRSYLRKALEAYYTLWMEILLSKQRILELYLNQIELGPGLYGIGAAAKVYYGKNPDQLTARQMIALAAILPNPLEWSPVKPNEKVRRKIRRIERLSARAPFPQQKLQTAPE
jgi:monofunctional biosynthetic peptidoglycan transglycosylase